MGILAGDYLKEASDCNVEMVAVGFLYRYGYFTQTLSMDGQQLANYEPQNFNQLPVEQVTDENGHPIVLEVPYPGRIIYANIWKVSVGRVPLYLMDTDLDLNSEFDRPITYQLYGGDWDPRIAIVGKPNVGKSSIVNRLLGENRVIVSNIAGTTRDAIDTEIVHNGKEYIFIDTAGLRRKNKIKEELERYSIIRTVSAVERADVVLMVIDATEGVTEQDAKIAGIAHERGKGVIIVVNKWDAIEKNDKTMKEYEGKIRQVLSYMPYAEIMYVSALTGQRLPKLYDMIDMVIENQTLRIATGVLNEIMTEAVAMQQPPSDKGKRLKLYYITQVAVKPPTFVIFVNDKELMHFSYTRYLENKIREAFGFRGTSLKFFIRERKEKDQ